MQLTMKCICCMGTNCSVVNYIVCHIDWYHSLNSSSDSINAKLIPVGNYFYLYLFSETCLQSDRLMDFYAH